MKNTKRPGWSRLDNAAKVFPALANKKDSRVFRFACQLTEPVQKKALQQAAEQALEEFPIFTNIIRHGMFWYYLEESGEMPIVHEEDQNVCSRLYDKNEHHLLIDISYYKCRINFEVFHAMADATGALMFLKTLVVNYLKIVHPVLAHEDLSLGIDSTFREKDSDSFSQYYNKEEKNSSMSFLGEKTVPIFHFHEPSTPDFFQQVTEAEVSTRQIIAAAKQYHTTVTVFLVSLLILSIYDAMEPRDRKKAVRIMVPVNLRSYFPSATVRNFFGLIAVTYDRKKQGETLEDVIAAVAENFRRELTKEKLEKMTPDERFAFWQNELSRCIRCNACRDVCPACTCEKCVFDNPNSGVENKAASNEFEEKMFHIIRAFHVAGRCTDCGECSRVCPQHIPLHLLNRKFIKDINAFYGDYQAGEEVGSRAPVVNYTTEDIEPGEAVERGEGDA